MELLFWSIVGGIVGTVFMDITWFVAGGSASAMMYTFRQPGLYVYLNHNLIEALLLGAAAQIKVEGEWNDDLMLQISNPGPIQ